VFEMARKKFTTTMEEDIIKKLKSWQLITTQMQAE
jgi:hypothetical protein